MTAIDAVVVLAQRGAEDDTSSATVTVAVVFALVALLAIVGVASRGGRRLMLPVVAILLGASIVATSIAETRTSGVISVVTFIGIFVGAVVAIGGVGALREGVALPDVSKPDPDEVDESASRVDSPRP